MKNTGVVSVIIPIYKVEQYLRRCIDSIVNQTYTNLEIILVDDGSPDNCSQICDEYAAKDKRIIVIHKENGGLSDARNAGLEICKGEYVSFVDSDDWIANSFVEQLVNAVILHDADISVTNFIYEPRSSVAKAKPDSNIEILDSQQSVKKLWSNDYVTFVTAWGKIYKASLFTSIRFPKGKIHEDEYTTYKLLYQSKKTVFLNQPLYFYFQRKDSITAKASSNSLKILDAMIERYLFFKEHNENEIVELCLRTLCWDLLFAYSLRKSTIQGYSVKDMLNLYRTAVVDYENISKPSQHVRLLKLFAHFPFLYLIYRKFSPYKIRLK